MIVETMKAKPEFAKGFKRQQYEILTNAAAAIFTTFAVVDLDNWLTGELSTERFIDMPSTKVRRGFDLLEIQHLDDLFQYIVTKLTTTWEQL
jgi:hypothetical protein